MERQYITVTQLTKYIKYKIDNDPNLMRIYLKGEISNYKAHTRGHLYFTLKDENTRINAIMFSSSADKLKFIPQDGAKVLVSGRISVYEATGAYQIYVDSMEEDGLGNLYVAFEQLKKKLEAEGLFDPKHKKEIPKIPTTIGIITAPTGAAIKDILSTIKRRWPVAKTILFPSLVQGMEAKDDLVRNLELAKKFNLDVVIIGRGGGSIEDMWCFNEEIVARAIYDFPIPIISAVGHEIDFTISDFVADLRAPTPTGAAEMAVPDKREIVKYIHQLTAHVNTNMLNILATKKEYLNYLKESYVLKNPITIYQIKEEKFDRLYEKLLSNYKSIITINKNKLELIENRINNGILKTYTLNSNKYERLLNKLEALNPLLVLKRGYAVTRKNSKVIDSITQVKTNDTITVELKDGNINAKVM